MYRHVWPSPNRFPRGREVARAQLELQRVASSSVQLPRQGTYARNALLHNGRFPAVALKSLGPVNRPVGALHSRRPRPHQRRRPGEFWRAPVDNDYGAGTPELYAEWRNPLAKAEPPTHTIRTGKNETASIIFDYSLFGGDGQYAQEFTVHGNGSIEVTNELRAVAGEAMPGLNRWGAPWLRANTATCIGLATGSRLTPR